jgi:hypothetical protein
MLSRVVRRDPGCPSGGIVPGWIDRLVSGVVLDPQPIPPQAIDGDGVVGIESDAVGSYKGPPAAVCL